MEDEPKAIFVPNIPNPAKMTIDERATAFIVSDLLVTNCIVRLSLFGSKYAVVLFNRRVLNDCSLDPNDRFVMSFA